MRKPRVEVAVGVPKSRLPIPASRLARDAEKVLEAAEFRGRLSLAIVTDAEMRRVNREFHDCDEPTDVLAFALGAGRGEGFDGEVVVSLDTARREAAEHGVEPAAELMLYVVHGVLHLTGYDDHALADARRMHARALSILADLGHRNTIRARAKSRPSRRNDPRSSA